MPDAGFQFAQPFWLWALLLIIVVAFWLRFSSVRGHRGPVDRYADEHLLPYLLGTRELGIGARWGKFARWSLLWSLGLFAMAGPRWDFTDMQVFRPGSDLVVLLDISRSMQVEDVQPSRLGRARQEIFDLINEEPPIRIGLIAFASTAHVVSPITEDTQTIRNTLPSLSTELVRLQGSRVSFALERASQLLAAQPEDSARTILLISDGDFDEAELVARVRELAASGIRLIVVGVGTAGGGPVPAADGSWMVDRERKTIESRLNADELRGLARAGNGIYLEADYRGDDTEEIIRFALERSTTQAAGDEKTRIWNERFYLFLLPLLLLLLPKYRRIPT